ncbi:MAG: FtsQ-type POTRA domain-containing protein [Actinobacteria bacterium]|nr:FtsQ-type POTRA domain-containing protein [Actinomycetota bacterium]
MMSPTKQLNDVIEIDRRLLRRRREVAEGRARSSLSRLGIFLLFALFAGLVVWLFRSPLLAVTEISVEGALPNLVPELRSEAGIDLGQPLVTVKPSVVEANLKSDPRVLASEVDLVWPHQVRIRVTPRLPVAWIVNGTEWALVGVDAVVLETAGEPGSGMPQVIIDPVEQAALLGALEFASNLDPLLFAGARVEVRGEELWAMVGGYEARLGRAIDMAEKARVLNALLRQSLVPGSIINLIAPSRPAIIPA